MAEDGRGAFQSLFRALNARACYPAAYSQSAGKPLGPSADGAWRYDVLGYRGGAQAEARAPGEGPRVFVVGDGTLLEGPGEADTVPGLLQALLRRTHGAGARVHNFGAVSACLNQMTALTAMRLAELEPDLILVVGGAADVLQPWSFDPRPGQPFNQFVTEGVHETLFDPDGPAGADGLGADLTYAGLGRAIFERLDNLRALTRWQSELWEWEVVRHFEIGLKRLARLARGVDAPVRFVLQPALAGKEARVGAERTAAPEAFMTYFERQYARFGRVVADLDAAPRPAGFGLRDLGGLFAGEPGEVFTDVVNTTPAGRARLAEALAEVVAAALPAGGPA